MFLSVVQYEPPFGFYDDTIGKFEVRCVGSEVMYLILDLQFFILDRD
jgi:hypothetical protein